MKVKARANSNIAIVKYWGKRDEKLRLPTNSSVSITLDKLWTETEVEFDKNFDKDVIEYIDGKFRKKEILRIIEHLERIRNLAKINTKARVVTRNNFEKAAGMASSASGFAALSLAGSRAAGLNLSDKELSILARQGSGSACRSISGGIVVWHKGEDNQSSYAEQIKFNDQWGLRILLVKIKDSKEKKISSTEGMKKALLSPYFKLAIDEAEKNVKRTVKALRENDWKVFGEVVEAECFRLHMLTMTSKPPIIYWKPGTLEVFSQVFEMRKKRVEGFVTVDAGSHVHVICREKDVEKITMKLNKIRDVERVLVSGIGKGARVI